MCDAVAAQLVSHEAHETYRPWDAGRREAPPTVRASARAAVAQHVYH